MSFDEVRASGLAPLAFDLQGLSIWSGSDWVVEGVDFRIPSGAFCVVLGANGAGKSTLLAALSGVLTQPWAIARRGVFQSTCGHLSNTNGVVWLGQKLTCAEDMSVREFLHLPDGKDTRPILHRRSWSLFGADELMNHRLSALSGGQWQRVRLARALAFEGDVLLFDEPDTALDVRWRHVLWSTLRERASRGATIVLALHHFAEVRESATHWVGLARGRQVFCELASNGFPQAYVDSLFSEKSLTR